MYSFWSQSSAAITSADSAWPSCCAFAQACAAEVEAQHGPAQAPLGRIEHLHGVIDHLVVHGAAADGMRMADKRRRIANRLRLRSAAPQAGRRDHANQRCAKNGFPNSFRTRTTRLWRSFQALFYADAHCGASVLLRIRSRMNVGPMHIRSGRPIRMRAAYRRIDR